MICEIQWTFKAKTKTSKLTLYLPEFLLDRLSDTRADWARTPWTDSSLLFQYIVAMVAVHLSLRSPEFRKCLSLTLNRRPRVLVSSPVSSLSTYDQINYQSFYFNSKYIIITTSIVSNLKSRKSYLILFYIVFVGFLSIDIPLEFCCRFRTVRRTIYLNLVSNMITRISSSDNWAFIGKI